MGLLLCKCCCCYRSTNNRSSVGVLPPKQLKVLLLGLGGSGKTEVGHSLSNKKRLDYESTNGVQYFQMELPDGQLSMTEIGGNAEMQKIWHHYFVTTMGIIYCFDMSKCYEELRESFELLRKTLMHPFVRGKPILLIATKSDLVDEGVQLYDIENTFQLEALAKSHSSSIRLCSYGVGSEREEGANNLLGGSTWLLNYLMTNYDILKVRVKCDTNMKTWQNQTEKLMAEGKLKRRRYQRFPKKRVKFWRMTYGSHRSRRIRPRTAPPIIYTISQGNEVKHKIASTELEEYVKTNEVPNVMETEIVENGRVTSV